MILYPTINNTEGPVRTVHASFYPKNRFPMEKKKRLHLSGFETRLSFIVHLKALRESIEPRTGMLRTFPSRAEDFSDLKCQFPLHESVETPF